MKALFLVATLAFATPAFRTVIAFDPLNRASIAGPIASAP